MRRKQKTLILSINPFSAFHSATLGVAKVLEGLARWSWSKSHPAPVCWFTPVDNREVPARLLCTSLQVWHQIMGVNLSRACIMYGSHNGFSIFC